MSRPSDPVWDVCILGAGPAGSLLASRLAQANHRVLLVDKAVFPRPKVCGGCLGSVGMEALRDAGVSLEDLGVDSLPLNDLTVHRGSLAAELPLAGRRVVSREAFDHALLKLAKRRGVTVEEGCRARVGHRDGAYRQVTLRTERREWTAAARVIVIATGLGGAGLLPREEAPSVLRGRLAPFGVGACVPDPSGSIASGRLVMATSESGAGYVGMVKLPDGRIDIAAALRRRSHLTKVDRVGGLVAGILSESGVRSPGSLEAAPWRTVPTLTQRPSRLAAERVFLIGDAAGYIEPFTGEGMGWALRNAMDCEGLVSEAVYEWTPGLATRWEARHRAGVGSMHARCKLVCGAIGSRWIGGTVLRMLQLAPWSAGPVLRRIDPVAGPHGV